MSIVRFVPVVRPVVAVAATGLTKSIVQLFVPVVRPVAVATGAGAGGSVVRAFVPVRLCERVLMIDEVFLVVLVRAMVEWFQSKGVGGFYSCGIKATK